MKILRKRLQGSWVLRLFGPLVRGVDLVALCGTVEQLRARGQRRIILDLSGVAYLDAAGIGELVHCVGSVRDSGGEVVLAGAREKVSQILRLSGTRLPLARNVDEALGRLRRSGRPLLGGVGKAAAHGTNRAAIMRRTTEGPWRFTPIPG